MIWVRGCFFLPPVDDSSKMQLFVALAVRSCPVFSFFDPRASNLVLGLAIGLSLSLAWHWVHWAIR